MPDSVFAAAIRTVKEGMSARAGLAAARAAGLRIQDATWFRMVGTVARDLADQVDNVTRPLNRRPTPDEIRGFQSKGARGYMYYVDVAVKDRATGAVAIRPYAVRTQRLITRGEAVSRALTGFRNAIEDNPSEYDEQVLGAMSTNVYQYVPEE